MKQFSNLETQLVAKWFGNKIDMLVNENQSLNEMNLTALLSESIQNTVNEDLELLTEGYVSEIIHNSLDKVDYHELIQYFKN